jgi:8-oxo-dGTP diphosphatase
LAEYAANTREGAFVEKWDVYDRNGNLAGYAKTRSDVWSADEYHLGACLWIINREGHLLIQKRAASKRKFPNAWGNVGGSAISGETSRQCCAREVLEEVGITVNGNDLVFLQRSVFKNGINDDYALLLDFPIEDVVIQADEVSEAKWASVDEIKQLFAQRLFMMDDLAEIEKLIHYIHANIRIE